MLDVAVVKASVPKGMRSVVTQDLIDKLNNLSNNPVENEMVQESFVSYMDILSTGKYKLESYLNAVKFVTYMSLKCGTLEAWVKVFPDKYAACLASQVEDKTIYSYASHYKKGKLVNELLERMMIPTQILNAPYLQEAINKQVDLMRHSKSERIQLEASSSLITNLKMPETAKLEIDVGIKEDSQLAELARLSAELAMQQHTAIKGGTYNALDIAHQRITLEGELDTGEDDA